MTVSVTVRAPTAKGAKVTVGDTVHDVRPGEEITLHVCDDQTLSVQEADQAATLDSGGGGHGDPDKPK